VEVEFLDEICWNISRPRRVPPSANRGLLSRWTWRHSRAAGPTTNTARHSPRYEGKTRGCHCSYWAPDGERENARNML